MTQLRLLDWHEMDTPRAIERWDRLAERASEPNPFCESWFLRASHRAFPWAKVGLLCLVSGDDLLALMPLHRPDRYYGRPVPHIANWLHPNCFIGAPLVVRGAEHVFWQALLSWCDDHAGLALFLHIAALPLDGALHAALVDTLARQSRPSAVVFRTQHVVLQSTMSAEDYFIASLSGKKRKELGRQARRLGELGALAFRRQDDDADLEPWIAQFFALEAAGWKGHAGSALACDPATRGLFAEALGGAARRGRLERIALTLDDRPIAMLANFLAPPGAFSFKTAFDESLAAYSPGVLLQRENLALMERDGIEWVDSCATQDHPMIAHIWRERRPVGRVNIAIGGGARRMLFKALTRAELGRNPTGVEP
jgi:hypothetical protein